MKKPIEPLKRDPASFICDDAKKKVLAINVLSSYMGDIGNDIGMMVSSGLFRKSEANEIGMSYDEFSKQVKSVLTNKFKLDVGPILIDCMKKESGKKEKESEMHS